MKTGNNRSLATNLNQRLEIIASLLIQTSGSEEKSFVDLLIERETPSLSQYEDITPKTKSNLLGMSTYSGTKDFNKNKSELLKKMKLLFSLAIE